MASFWSRFGFGAALSENTGQQNPVPGVALVSDSGNIGPDAALQISAVWACIDRRATTIASLPFFAYETVNGQKTLARNSRLYGLLHESPNSRMTPIEFWRAMMMNHDLRGNAYARIERDARGEAVAMWPMPADQVEVRVLDDGAMVYQYTLGNDVAIYSETNVLHLKNLGNGTVGLSKLEFMRATTDEVSKAQGAASKVFGTGGKPTGVLMLDKVLKPEQRASLMASFAGMAEGNSSRLYVLEANMKYEQLSMSPEDQQLLETRNFGVSEICRWFDVPPVLVHHNDTTTWGSGIEQIVDGFYKLTIRPMLVSIEQAVRKRVMTPRQRSSMSVEFSLDALLRGNPAQRAELYAKNVQNGIMTRNECRQLENLQPVSGADALTAQSNLLPLDKLGQEPAPANETPAEPILQAAYLREMETKAQDQRHMEIMGMLKAGDTKPVINTTVNLTQDGSKIQVTTPEAKSEVHHHHQTTVEGANITLPAPVVRNEINVEPTPVTLEATIKNEMPAVTDMRIVGMPQRTTTAKTSRVDGKIVEMTQIEKDA